MRRTTLWVGLVLVVSGCNSLVGFDLEGGEDGGGGETKTLVVTRTGDMRGTVTSVPSGINCSPTVNNCSHDFPRNSMVTLTAASAPGSLFTGWSAGACSGTGPCTLTLGIDTSIEARFDDASGGHNFAFVTKSDYAATMFNPLTNADAICANEAMAAGLPAGGAYKAWLSTSTVDAKDRLGTARGWVRVDGLPIADTLADVTSGKLLHPIRIKADLGLAQNDGADHAVIVTGTYVTGLHATATCSDWTSGSAMLRTGNANSTGRIWTDWFDGDCTGQLGFYCFGTSRSTPLAVTPTPGRLAFVTSGTWTSGGGLASADAFCQADATTAGRTGTFKALLATSTASAASRFDTGGAPWVRPDGIPIAKPGVSPFDELVAPINVRLDGVYLPGAWAATGATSPTAPGATSRNCNDWTSSSAGVYVVGSVEDSFTWFTEFGPQTVSCANPAPLYCFQE